MGIFDFLMGAADSVQGITKTVSDISGMSGEMSHLFSEDGVSAETFLRFCDLRSYDFNNKCNDVKIVKNIDFQGAYILYNQTLNKHYIGVSSRVYRKVERIFHGYEKEQPYKEWCRENKFRVRLIRLDDTEFNTVNELYQHLKKVHVEDIGYHFI